MVFNVDYDVEKVSNVTLVPSDDEDADTLYQYSRMLNIENPAIQFSKEAKAKKFDRLTDEEYFEALNRVKWVELCFFGHKPKVNIFKFASQAMNYIMQYDRYLLEYLDKLYITEGVLDKGKLDEKTLKMLQDYHKCDKDMSVSDLMRFYNLNMDYRTSIYSLIEKARGFALGDGSIDETFYEMGGVNFYVPDECYTRYIKRGNVLVVITFYDPYGECACTGDGEPLDTYEFGSGVAEEIEGRYIMIQRDENFDSLEVDKMLKSGMPIYFYCFVQTKTDDFFDYMGKLKYEGEYIRYEDDPLYVMKVE